MATIDDMIPPAEMIFVGPGDFKSIGEEFLQHFVTLGGLNRTDCVLDLGCGIGRMAIPLTQYLTREGAYEGIDVVPAAIKWCQERITSQYGNFRFTLADIYNKHYNPGGRMKACEYVLPHASQSFDYVFMTSVMTHLLPVDARHYLAEVERVMKPKARAFITYFLLAPDVMDRMALGQSAVNFAFNGGECRTTNPSIPEEVVAYPEEWIRELYGETGLDVIEPVHSGSWSGRSDCLTFQDVVIATKSQTLPALRLSQ